MGIIAAMEQAQEENLGAETLEQAADQAAAVGEDRVEVVDQAADIEADAGDVSEAVADVGELSEIGEIAEASVESGEGLSEQAAEIATVAIERIHNRLGFSGKQRIVPATESFGHAGTRLASTKLVIESIGDTIKQVWEAIKAMAKRIWDKITQFFKKIFGSAKSLRDHLENLKKRAIALDASAKPAEKDLSGAVAAKVGVKKKADLSTYRAIADNAIKLAGLSRPLAGEAVQLGNGLGVVTGKLASNNFDEAELKNFLTEASKQSNKTNAILGIFEKLDEAGVESTVKSSGKGKGSTVVYGPFASGTGLIVKTNENRVKIDGQEVVYELTTMSFGVGKKDKQADKAKALDRGEVLSVIEMATKVCDAVEELERNKSTLDKMVKDAETACDNALKAMAKMAGDNAKPAVRVALNESRDVTNYLLQMSSSIGQKIPSVVINVAYAGADYASASIANLRVGK